MHTWIDKILNPAMTHDGEEQLRVHAQVEEVLRRDYDFVVAMLNKKCKCRIIFKRPVKILNFEKIQLFFCFGDLIGGNLCVVLFRKTNTVLTEGE